MARTQPHIASEPSRKTLTVAGGPQTGGTLADGTGAGPYYRFKIDVSRSGTISLAWWTPLGVGVATHIKFWAARRAYNDTALDNLDPSTNGAWGPQTPWFFMDGAMVEVIPDGASLAGTLPLQDIGEVTILVEVLVEVDIPEFTIDLSIKAP